MSQNGETHALNIFKQILQDFSSVELRAFKVQICWLQNF